MESLVTVPGAALKQALSLLAKVAPKKTSIPIISGVRLETVDGRLVLQATDLDNYLTARLPCTGALKPIVVSASAFDKVVRGLKKGTAQVQLANVEKRLAVESNGQRSQLPWLADAADWPVFPALDAKFVGIDTEGLLAALDYCLPAASRDETRVALCSVHLGPNGTTATDGHRLHQSDRFKLDVGQGETRLSRAGGDIVARILRTFDGAPGYLDLCSTGSGADTATNAYWRVTRDAGPDLHVALCSRAITEGWPDTAQVIPDAKKAKITARVDGEKLREALKPAGRYDVVTLTFEVDRIAIMAKDPDRGDVFDTVDARIDAKADGPAVIGLNPAYVLSAIADAQDVDLYWQGEQEPLRVDLDGRIAVIMPCRL